MEIGTRIKQLRTERHISQEALANALNISRQSVTKWENNASKRSTANILALCEFFDVPLNELMVADNVSQGTSEIEERSDTKVRFWEKIPLKCILIISGFLFVLSVAGMIIENRKMDSIIGYADNETSITVYGASLYLYVLCAVAVIVVLVSLFLLLRSKHMKRGR